MNEEQYLESIVKPLLTHPEDFSIKKINDDRGIFLTIKANSIDMGRLIGKAGSTANSIRTLLRQFGALTSIHISIKISDPISRKFTLTSDREMLG